MGVTLVLKLFITTWYLWALIILTFVYSLFKPKIKGIMGEKTVATLLLMLNSDKYKTINDVIIEDSERTSQIDHVVVSNYGVFVIETKNYRGWIYGDEYSKYWTQIIYKRKEKLYNPIRQNYGHIQALKHHLSDYEDILYIPIIVFSTKASLRVTVSIDVIYTVNLLNTIKKYKEEVITDEVKEKIYSKIINLNINDKEIRKEHISSIKKEKGEIRNKIESNICPKCGGVLVIREGKYGSFKGCSNYPKCKFTSEV